MNLLFWIFACLGILFLSYYIVIAVYAGIGTAFSKFWFILAIVCAFISAFMKYMMIHKLKIASGFCSLFFLIIIIGLIIFAFIEAALIYHSRQKAEQGIKYMIILGAQIKGTVISKSLMKRLVTGLIYLKENQTTAVIVSGGKGDKEALTEAEAMKQYLIAQGIEERRIIKEDKSRNTFENILYSKAFFKTDSQVVIVTNGFHMFRSLRLAKKQGLNAQGLAARTDVILAVNYYVREAVGVLKDKLLGNI